MSHDLDALARDILDANRYMTLATADASGRPWACPVYYAHAGHRELYWLSAPEATHSRNLAARPELGIVVFDSHTKIGAAQAVYMAASAEQLTGDRLERGIDVFSRRSVEHGARPWTVEDARAPAPLRLYLATVTGHSVLDPAKPRDERIPVSP